MYLLFDIGGTHMRFAFSRDGQNLMEVKVILRPEEFDEAMDTFRNIVKEVGEGEKIEAAGGGIAGTFDKGEGVFLHSPHISSWVGKPLQKTIEEIVGAPAFIENDAALGGLAEAMYGAGKDYLIVAYITVGTGVGGARIVGRHIDAHALGFEPGHQVIDVNGLMCSSCGVPGHLEDYISGSAIEKRYQKKPYEITDKAFWEELSRYLGVGVINAMLHWSPDVVVLGGSMLKTVGIPIDSVRSFVGETLKVFPEPPPIVQASLGDIAGLHGALAFVTFIKQSL